MRIVQTRAHNISPKKNHTLKDEIIILAQLKEIQNRKTLQNLFICSICD